MAMKSRSRLGSLVGLCVLVAAVAIMVGVSAPAAGAPNQETPAAYCQGFNGTDVFFPGAYTWINSPITINCAPPGARVTKIDVIINVRHVCPQAVRVELRYGGRTRVLWNKSGTCGDVLYFAKSDNDVTTFNRLLVNGTWQLYAVDEEGFLRQYIDYWQLKVYYPQPTATATRTYTPGPTETPTPTRQLTATPTRPSATVTPTATTEPGCDYLQADFDWSVFCSTGFTFADRSTSSPGDPIDSWHWDFSDGNESALQNPSHSFSEGFYPVTLTVATLDGCEASITKEVAAFHPRWAIHKELVEPLGRPPHVGDELTYHLAIAPLEPHAIDDYSLFDIFDVNYFDYVSASPPPDGVKPIYGSTMMVEWSNQGPIPLGQERGYLVTLRAKAEVLPPLIDYKCNQVRALLFFASNDCGYSHYQPACVEILPRPTGIRLEKFLIDPSGAVANVGDAVEYEIRIENQGMEPVTLPFVYDSFDVADYDFVSANPPPDTSQQLGNTWMLEWENRTIGPGASLVIHVRLRTKRPAQQAENCAGFTLPSPEGPPLPGIDTLAGEIDCAHVEVRAIEGRHFTVTKRFTLPTNHIARMGEWVTFETKWLLTGSEPANGVHLYDYIAPASVSSYLPLQIGILMPAVTGDWAKVHTSFKPEAPAAPAVNTARWTVSWPDGTKSSKIARDYVHILDPDDPHVPRGLVVSKNLMEPIGGAQVGDTITFRVIVTNTTGLVLQSLALTDTFDDQCLSYQSASVPPDGVAGGAITWNSLGALGPGQSIALDVIFRADAACPATLNCMKATAQVPGDAPLIAVDCTPLFISGERPQLTLVKRRISPSPALLGQIVEWEIEIENVGTAPQATVSLHDGYQAAYLEYDSASPPPDSIDLPHGRLDWSNLGPLTPGQKLIVALRLRATKPGVSVLNCAETTHDAGSLPLVVAGCDTVDILAEGPGIQVVKERAVPAPGVGAAAGSTEVFTVTLRNVGGVALSDLRVSDSFDADCLEFLNAPGMNTMAPHAGLLRWHLPSLNPGDELSWQVVFNVKAPCELTMNCVEAAGRGPSGAEVAGGDCAEIDTVPPHPGVMVRKNLYEVVETPTMGDLLVFEVMVQNSGNSPLVEVNLRDMYDTDCLELVGTFPPYDYYDPPAGEVRWHNLAPLLPGEGRLVYLLFRPRQPCWPMENCAGSHALDVNRLEVHGEDCAPAWVGLGGERHLYIPLVLNDRETVP